MPSPGCYGKYIQCKKNKSQHKTGICTECRTRTCDMCQRKILPQTQREPVRCTYCRAAPHQAAEQIRLAQLKI